jgi:membrane-bound lytic murein transglycosylase D
MPKITTWLAPGLLITLLLSGCGSTPVRHPNEPEITSEKGVSTYKYAVPKTGGKKSADGKTLESYEFNDLFDRIRAGYAIADTSHPSVLKEVEWYRTRPDFLDRTFNRGSRYLYYIVEELERRGMPLELALLPVVESAFNPVAYSRSHASGLWQFIPSTGKYYGLEQNWWIDERRDVIRSTDTALTYLQYLNKFFNGDWYLAIAAYNGGEGTVSRAVKKNAAAGKATNFFSLDLKAETRDYVPKLLAISRIVKDPKAYGLVLAAIPNEPFFGMVDPGRQVHLGKSAETAEVPMDLFFALNPGFNRMTTPPEGPHRLLLPVERVEPFAALLRDGGLERVAANTTSGPAPKRHTVKRGESLGKIASRYNVAVNDLRKTNGLKRYGHIHPGQVLTIPGSYSNSENVAETRSDLSQQVLQGSARTMASVAGQSKAAPVAKPTPSAKTHRVAAGDTLWGISQRYGLTVQALAQHNDISSRAPLKVGDLLKIPSAKALPSNSSPLQYQVRNGDTLMQIARKFNVPLDDVLTWNGLTRSSVLQPGQQIVVYPNPNNLNGG